jgi:hypothetical protein
MHRVACFATVGQTRRVVGDDRERLTALMVALLARYVVGAFARSAIFEWRGRRNLCDRCAPGRIDPERLTESGPESGEGHARLCLRRARWRSSVASHDAVATTRYRVFAVVGMSLRSGATAAWDSGTGAPTRYLHCPRCRLSIRPRAISLHLIHCPRCVARSRTLVELFASPLPAERLHSDSGTSPLDGRWATSPRTRSRAGARPLDDDR